MQGGSLRPHLSTINGKRQERRFPLYVQVSAVREGIRTTATSQEPIDARWNEWFWARAIAVRRITLRSVRYVNSHYITFSSVIGPATQIIRQMLLFKPRLGLQLLVELLLLSFAEPGVFVHAHFRIGERGRLATVVELIDRGRHINASFATCAKSLVGRDLHLDRDIVIAVFDAIMSINSSNHHNIPPVRHWPRSG